eukprot:TRINITY_DN17716_c0_g1_i2.p1 TRINITY_DN17716_c0_g1~~TRINITY_DN17716_c0_g1_i2.p1  ORF type:complete len:250 (-),score=44.66 TRINITY_DN17716_c0_g1_i2:802-1551(-)
MCIRDSSRPEVHAFYYLWYGEPRVDGGYLHWNHRILPHWTPHIQRQYDHLKDFTHSPPGYLHAPFYPMRGPYSSSDPEVLAAHMAQMRAHGISAAVVSWTGREEVGTSDTQGVVTDRVVPLALRAAEQHGIKIAIHLEPYHGRSPRTIHKDLVYLHARHQHSAALLKMKRPSCVATGATDCPSLPVFYVYDSYHNAVSEWGELLCEGRPGSIRGTKHDSVMISTLLSPSDQQLVTEGCFDVADCWCWDK